MSKRECTVTELKTLSIGGEFTEYTMYDIGISQQNRDWYKITNFHYSNENPVLEESRLFNLQGLKDLKTMIELLIGMEEHKDGN